ncbi:hypothetical protein AB1460_36960 [Parafrankia sp. FMc2]
MSPVAELLSASPHFAGPQHCPADAWIAAVAAGATDGNPEAWRRYGTLHHLTTVSEPEPVNPGETSGCLVRG